MKFVVESAGGVASRVRVGEHELHFDQPESVPFGKNSGPSPLDVLAASVAACAHYFAAAYLQARHLPVDRLRVSVDAEKVKDPSPRFGRISIRVEVPPNLSPEQMRALDRVVRNCPAYGTLLHGPDVDLEVHAAASDAA
jgi:putative redox protein